MPEVETAYKTLLAQFGEPEFVLSDRGSEFNFLPDDRLRTTAEHPEGHSKLERFHKELGKISRVHGLPPIHAVHYLQTDEKRSLFVNGRREQGRAPEYVNPATSQVRRLFVEVDLVLRHVPRRRRSKSASVWSAPLLVKKVVGDRNYIVTDGGRD